MGAAAGLGSLLLKLVFPSCVPPQGGERQPRRGAPCQYCHSPAVHLLLLELCDPCCGHRTAAPGTGGEQSLCCKTGGARVPRPNHLKPTSV